MESLKHEQQMAEDRRVEQEEEMWRLHECHKAELERKDRQLADMMDEAEKACMIMEQDLDQERAKLEEEKSQRKWISRFCTPIDYLNNSVLIAQLIPNY